jgi:hypothetical protein
VLRQWFADLEVVESLAVKEAIKDIANQMVRKQAYIRFLRLSVVNGQSQKADTITPVL